MMQSYFRFYPILLILVFFYMTNTRASASIVCGKKVIFLWPVTCNLLIVSHLSIQFFPLLHLYSSKFNVSSITLLILPLFSLLVVLSCLDFSATTTTKDKQSFFTGLTGASQPSNIFIFKNLSSIHSLDWSFALVN